MWFGGAAGGLLGGGAVGILEGIYLLVSAAEVTDYQALPYGAFLYGLLGLGIGVCAAVPLHLLSVVTRRPLRASWAWALGWSLAFAGPGLAIAVWVARRDFFGEVLPPTAVLGELFADRFTDRRGNSKSARAKSTIVGNLFREYLDTEFTVGGQKWRLARSYPEGEKRKPSYGFEVVP